MSNTTAIQIQINQLIDDRTVEEKKLAAAQSGYNAAGIFILIGIFATFLFGPSILLLLIAVPALLTQGAKRSKAQVKVDDINREIKALREKLLIASETTSD